MSIKRLKQWKDYKGMTWAEVKEKHKTWLEIKTKNEKNPSAFLPDLAFFL